MATTPTVQTRPRTILERQPYIFAYGAGISAFSPLATLYQRACAKLNPHFFTGRCTTRCCAVCKLNPQVSISKARMVRLAATIFPVQTLLKAIQSELLSVSTERILAHLCCTSRVSVNASTPIKEYLNPWAAFAVVGVLQGGVYGQATIYYSQQLGLNKKVDLRGLFRGVGFAAARDLVSQGIPFMWSGMLRDALFGSAPAAGTDSEVSRFTRHWAPILMASVASTCESHKVTRTLARSAHTPILRRYRPLAAVHEPAARHAVRPRPNARYHDDESVAAQRRVTAIQRCRGPRRAVARRQRPQRGPS